MQPTRAGLRLHGLVPLPDGSRDHASSDATTALEDGDGISITAKFVCGIEAANASADHDDFLGGYNAGDEEEEGQEEGRDHHDTSDVVEGCVLVLVPVPTILVAREEVIVL